MTFPLSCQIDESSRRLRDLRSLTENRLEEAFVMVKETPEGRELIKSKMEEAYRLWVSIKL